MALIPEAVATPAGTATAGRLPVTGDTIANLSDRTMLVLNNPSSGNTIQVTVTAVKPCNQGSLHNLVASVPNGSQAVIGPIDSRYASNSTGLATVSYSGTLTGSTVYTTRV